jgi:arginyl-tRNA--protein-N-Asp/Glu arginylyltransferase
MHRGHKRFWYWFYGLAPLSRRRQTARVVAWLNMWTISGDEFHSESVCNLSQHAPWAQTVSGTGFRDCSTVLAKAVCEGCGSAQYVDICGVEFHPEQSVPVVAACTVGTNVSGTGFRDCSTVLAKAVCEGCDSAQYVDTCGVEFHPEQSVPVVAACTVGTNVSGTGFRDCSTVLAKAVCGGCGSAQYVDTCGVEFHPEQSTSVVAACTVGTNVSGTGFRDCSTVLAKAVCEGCGSAQYVDTWDVEFHPEQSVPVVAACTVGTNVSGTGFRDCSTVLAKAVCEGCGPAQDVGTCGVEFHPSLDEDVVESYRVSIASGTVLGAATPSGGDHYGFDTTCETDTDEDMKTISCGFPSFIP